MNQIKAVVTRKNADYLQIHSSGNLMPFQFLTKVMAVCGDFKTPIHLISLFQCQYLPRVVELSSETSPPNGKPTVPIRFRQCGKRHFRHPYHRLFDQERENVEVKVIDLL